MLRALLARVGLTAPAPPQLELGLWAPRVAAPPALPPRRPRVPPAAEGAPARRGAPGRAAVERARAAAVFLERLRAAGLQGIETLTLTRNRRTLVSYRGPALRVHEGFQSAPDEVVGAIVGFVSGRGRARVLARRALVAYELPQPDALRPARRAPMHPDDRALAERLQREHARLNALHFAGALRPIPVTVSRRMQTRLGHYMPARSHPEGAEIAISLRHLRRHGLRDALDTLLHEMVHQWQDESGHPIDHGPTFRRKAREVGTVPRARRVLR